MSQPPTTATRVLLEGLPNVGGCVIADEDGRLVETVGAVPDAELWAAQAVTVAREMERLGVALQLGAAGVVTVQGRRATHVLGIQGGAVAAITFDPRRQSSDIENRLAESDWSAGIKPPAPPPSGPAPTLSEEPAALRHGSAERPAVFSGNLQLFAVPDLLEFLRNAQRTGTLRCRSAMGIGTVQLVRGRITNAMSPSTGGLIEYLMKSGMLQAEQLDELTADLDDVPTSDALVARLLVERGVATPADLRAVTMARIHSAIRDLVTWVDGRFAFDSAAPLEPAVPGTDVELDSQPVLLNIFREQDEATKAR